MHLPGKPIGWKGADSRGRLGVFTPTGSARPPAALTSAHRPPPAPAAGRRGGPTWSPGPCRGGSGRTRTAPPGTRTRPSAGRAQRQTARPGPRVPLVRRNGGTRGRGGAAATGAPRPLPPRARRYGEARYLRAAGRQLRPASPVAVSRLLNSSICTGLLPLPPHEPFPLPWCALLPALGFYKGPGLMSHPWDGRPPPRTGTSVPPALQPPPCAEDSPYAVKTLPKTPLLTHGSHRTPVLCRAGFQNTITLSRERDN